MDGSLLVERLIAYLSPSLFRPNALASGLSRPRHAGWNVIARTIFAFLFLKHRIVHMDVVEYRRQIFMAQQLLQAEWIVALDEVIHGKRVPENVRANALALNISAFFESLEQHLH